VVVSEGLPIWIVEPSPVISANLTALKIANMGGKTSATEPPAINDTKKRLKSAREYASNNTASLIQELQSTLKSKYPEVKLAYANDHVEAVRYITTISNGISTLSYNNSAVVKQELRPALETAGFSVINSYCNEFSIKCGNAIQYWQLPHLSDSGVYGSFEVNTRLAKMGHMSASSETRDYIALLGVSAISADDCTILMCQHFSNIQKDITQAKKIIYVVGLEKIVRTSEEAVFQTKCMATFGMESVTLDVPTNVGESISVDDLAGISENRAQEVHILILDNDRSELLKSRFRELFQCIGCRACNSVCPARISGKPFSPREIVLNLKKHLPEVGSIYFGDHPKTDVSSPIGDRLVGNGAITRDEIWACTTCRACQDACPLQLEHTQAIIGLRQNLVMDQAVIPNTAIKAFRSIEIRGHPWQGTRMLRTSWKKGLGISCIAENSNVDFLYWVGCTEALEERSSKVARAIGQILKISGTSFAILADQESCCGEPARRLGNEYLFEIQVKRNIELLRSYHISNIITGCPHCYHTIKNEYPKYGGEFVVIHHTEFIARLLAEGKLRLSSPMQKKATYQDPCYLGRYNGIFEPPRYVLKNIPNTTFVEVDTGPGRSLCCGGGGGRMWLEERIGKRISEIRTERFVNSGAQMLLTACPYCLQMFDDAIKANKSSESLSVMDIAELVAGLFTLTRPEDEIKIVSPG
jgi:Fe-S oxidoreductase